MAVKALLRVAPDDSNTNEAVANDKKKRGKVTGPISAGRIGKT
jgi:hypothetical protein